MVFKVACVFWVLAIFYPSDLATGVALGASVAWAVEMHRNATSSCCLRQLPAYRVQQVTARIRRSGVARSRTAARAFAGVDWGVEFLAHKRNTLTAIQVQNATPGKLSDGGGLLLDRTADGGRWSWRYTFGGKVAGGAAVALT